MKSVYEEYLLNKLELYQQENLTEVIENNGIEFIENHKNGNFYGIR